jgi:hypothetical protein
LGNSIFCHVGEKSALFIKNANSFGVASKVSIAAKAEFFARWTVIPWIRRSAPGGSDLAAQDQAKFPMYQDILAKFDR